MGHYCVMLKFPIVIKMYTVLFTVLTLSSVTAISTIHPTLNPGCKGCSVNDTILIYTKAQDDSFDYTIHQIWDFTGHLPTMLYIVGNKNSSIDVQWDGHKPSQIMTDGSFYSFAMILNNLFEYNDTDPDQVYFDYKYPHREIPLRDVTWRLDEGILNNDMAKARVRGALSWKKHGMIGVIDLKLLLLPMVGRSQTLPRLYHSVNSTQVDVSLVGLTVSPRYDAARFALRYVIVSQDDASSALHASVQRSIDDEYTPGVFETMSITTPGGGRGAGGFVQYRPVAYSMRMRDVESSVTAYVHYNKTEIPQGCLAERYYAQFNQDNVFVNELIASFGQSGDGFYTKTNYTVWTYSVGYGTPPAEGMSVFLIVMLTLGIGTPIIAMCCSYLVTRGMLRRHRENILEQEA